MTKHSRSCPRRVFYSFASLSNASGGSSGRLHIPRGLRHLFVRDDINLRTRLHLLLDPVINVRTRELQYPEGALRRAKRRMGGAFGRICRRLLELDEEVRHEDGRESSERVIDNTVEERRANGGRP